MPEPLIRFFNEPTILSDGQLGRYIGFKMSKRLSIVVWVAFVAWLAWKISRVVSPLPR